MSKSKFDDAKATVLAKQDGAQPSVLSVTDPASFLEPISMEEMAQMVADGAEMAPVFLQMEDGDQFRGYFMDRQDCTIEEIVDGKAQIKNAKRLVFEWATRDRKGTGVMVSLLEVTQLAQSIGEPLPADGSCFCLIGKGGERKTAKKRTMHVYNVFVMRASRPARRQLKASE